MLVPLSWLKEYVDITLPVQTLADRLTLAGMEVEEIKREGDWWDPATILVGQVVSALGGIRVERGSGSDEPLRAAADALAAGEAVALMPQGTIPRGRAFFDPELKGRWGAAKLAAMQGPDTQPDLLVLVSPFLSMRAMAAQKYPAVPTLLLRYPLRTDLVLPGLSSDVRVLMLHGDRDDLIPLQQAQALARLAPRAQLQVVPGAGHGDIQENARYLEAVRHAIRSTVKPTSQAQTRGVPHVSG